MDHGCFQSQFRAKVVNNFMTQYNIPTEHGWTIDTQTVRTQNFVGTHSEPSVAHVTREVSHVPGSLQ
jgi:hypothetical protein